MGLAKQIFGKLRFRITQLTSVAHFVGHHPTKRKVMGSIPDQGMCLGCRFSLKLGAYERKLSDVSLSHQCLFPFLSPSLPSLKKINEILKRKELQNS